MPDAFNIAELIRGLAEADSDTRKSAGAALFERGSALARSATVTWADDTELSACLLREAGDRVKMTVGIAVSPETFERMWAAWNSPALANVPPDQDAKEFELDFPGGVHLDILTTREPLGAGAIARYLSKFGEGIQQVEIHVNDVDRATEILRASFAIPSIYPATRAGADGTRVNFFLVPTETGKKLLVELVEAKP
jgi:hypothetical protein